MKDINLRRIFIYSKGDYLKHDSIHDEVFIRIRIVSRRSKSSEKYTDVLKWDTKSESSEWLSWQQYHLKKKIDLNLQIIYSLYICLGLWNQFYLFLR